MRFIRLPLLVIGILAACSASAQTRPATQPAIPGVTVDRDLKYGDAAGRGQLLDLYLPEKVNGDLPLIVWIHGGGWSAGDKEGCPALNSTGSSRKMNPTQIRANV